MSFNSAVIFLDEVDSTNQYALDNFASLPDGALVRAARQTAGRGRQLRKWLSPPDTNFYGSFVMKQQFAKPALASVVASLACIDALREAAPEIPFWIKWPNDVFVGNCKIAGILCESQNIKLGMVAGIGVNINMSEQELASVGQPCTSLLHHTKKHFSVKNFTKKLVSKLIEKYSTYSIFPKKLFNQWRDENVLIGETIELITPNGNVCGEVIEIGKDGEIILRVAGQIRKFFSGDISLNKASINFNAIESKIKGFS